MALLGYVIWGVAVVASSRTRYYYDDAIAGGGVVDDDQHKTSNGRFHHEPRATSHERARKLVRAKTLLREDGGRPAVRWVDEVRRGQGLIFFQYQLLLVPSVVGGDGCYNNYYP